MKLVLVTLAALALAGPALAQDVADFSAEATVAGVDPAVDGTRTLDVEAGMDAAGNPVVSIRLDGASVLP